MTVKLFYDDAYLREATAKVEAVDVNGEKIKILLDRTIFYPEGGGQPSDRGVIKGDDFRVEVENVYEDGGVWHEGRLIGKAPKIGDEVLLELDWEWRYENMRQHTGQHILSAVLKDMYGSNTTGFQIFPEYNKIEINFEGELTWEHVLAAELEANEIVWSDLDVKISFYESLPEGLELRKPLSDKVKGKIRIVEIPGVDIIPCGGTHVQRTGEVGFIKILNFYKKSRNIWRIEFACGYRALIQLEKLLRDYWHALDEMPNKNRPLVERVRELKSEKEALEMEKKALRLEMWEWKAKVLLKEAPEIGEIKVVSHVENTSMKDAQAFVISLVEKNPNTIALIAGENYVILAKNEGIKGISMNELLKRVLEKTGGGGGGSENLAKGGGFRAKPEDVLKAAMEIIQELLIA